MAAVVQSMLQGINKMGIDYILLTPSFPDLRLIRLYFFFRGCVCVGGAGSLVQLDPVAGGAQATVA